MPASQFCTSSSALLLINRSSSMFALRLLTWYLIGCFLEKLGPQGQIGNKHLRDNQPARQVHLVNAALCC